MISIVRSQFKLDNAVVGFFTRTFRYLKDLCRYLECGNFKVRQFGRKVLYNLEILTKVTAISFRSNNWQFHLSLERIQNNVWEGVRFGVIFGLTSFASISIIISQFKLDNAVVGFFTQTFTFRYLKDLCRYKEIGIRILYKEILPKVTAILFRS